MKNSPLVYVFGELRVNHNTLDEHLILRHGTPRFAAAAISSSTIAQKKFNTGRDPVEKTGDLTNRRHDCLVHEFGGLLHAIQSAAHQLVGADHLQAGSGDDIRKQPLHPMEPKAGTGWRVFPGV